MQARPPPQTGVFFAWHHIHNVAHSRNDRELGLIKYRPEIDGLRALAVLPVILCHTGIHAFQGGFVGVDIFFVISGFLITSILLGEQTAKGISIVRFYERRARRIMPALFVTMAVCAMLAWHSLLPDELQNFGQSLVATSVFANNILLNMTAGYWSLASEFKPLLHTWSLGVEEQFYVVFPLALMAARKLTLRQVFWILASAAVFSFALAVWHVEHKPNAAFYLLHTRAWELLAGAMMAVAVKEGWVDKLRSALPGGWPAGLGVAMVVVSWALFDAQTPSPGPWLLLPVFGTCLVVMFTTPNTFAHALLSQRHVVLVGLISYSAYLWHQPMFAFARILTKEQPSDGAMLALAGATLPLAYVSWRWVEKPFRQPGVVDRRSVFALSAIGSAAFISLGLYLHVQQGLPERLFGNGANIKAGMHISYNERAFQFKNDAFQRADAKKVLIEGNSFGRDFVNMTLESFDTSGVEIIYRDDLPRCLDELTGKFKTMYQQADIVVFASGGRGALCAKANIHKASADGKPLLYVGGKSFGYNLNWLVPLAPKDRALRYNTVTQANWDEEAQLTREVPRDHFLPIYDRLVKGHRQMPVTDEEGYMLTPDRIHLTQHGAVYLGPKVLWDTAYERALAAPRRSQNHRP